MIPPDGEGRIIVQVFMQLGDNNPLRCLEGLFSSYVEYLYLRKEQWL
jgi:hypothetical protein